jgi:hypothetical protein
MADPTRPVQDAIIDPIWGQWVHDDQLNHRPVVLQPDGNTRIFGQPSASTWTATLDTHGAVVGPNHVKAWAAGFYTVDITLSITPDVATAPTRYGLMAETTTWWSWLEYLGVAPANVLGGNSLILGPKTVGQDLVTVLQVGRWGTDSTLLRLGSSLVFNCNPT